MGLAGSATHHSMTVESVFVCLHSYLCMVWAGGSTNVVGRTLTGACALQPSFCSSYCTTLVLSLGCGNRTNTMGGGDTEKNQIPLPAFSQTGEG